MAKQQKPSTKERAYRRNFARYRIFGMIANIMEIEETVDLTDNEVHALDQARRWLEELVNARWGH